MPVKAYNGTTETTITDINGNVVTLSGTATNTTVYKRDGKCDVSFYYMLNGVTLPSSVTPYIATEHIEKGKHIITLSYPLTDLEENVPVDFSIYVTSSGGITTIPIHSLQATIFGQEILPPNGFSGKILAEDAIARLNLGILERLNFREGVQTNTNDATMQSANDTVVLYNISSISVKTIEEGTGYQAPQVFFVNSKFKAEDGSYLLLEEGGKIVLEDLVL